MFLVCFDVCVVYGVGVVCGGGVVCDVKFLFWVLGLDVVM